MSIFKLIREFSKRYGRSPSPSELDKLKKQSDIIQQQDTVIPFPGGGKDKVSPFKPRPKAETEAEMLERMNRQNKESVARLKKKKEKDLADKLKDYDGDPDAMAMGGRAGYSVGGLSKLLKMLQGKVGKKNITTADKIARPESALNREMFGDFNERVNRKILDVPPMPSGFQLSREKLLKNFPELDESYADEIMAMDKELQGRVLTMLKDRRKNPEAYDKLLMEKGDTLDFQGEFDRSVKRSKNADGGRADFNLGGLAKLLKFLSAKSPAGRYKDYLASVKKRSIEGDFKSLAPELGAVSAGGILVNRKMKSILEDMKEQDKERFLKEYIEDLNKDPSYKDRPELKDKLIENYTKSLFGEKKAGGGLAYMLGESRDNLKEGGAPSDVVAYRQMTLLDKDFDNLDLDEIIDILKSIGVDNKADGGIISLKEGGPPNPGRRNFMKLMAGLASIPIIGKFLKPAAKVAKTAKVVPLQNTTTTMPTWFPKLIDKALDKGIKNKVDADLTDIKVPELPGVKIQRHDDGRVLVEGKNDYGKPYAIEYEPPGFEVVNEKTGKAVKTKGDFKAIDSVPESGGYPDDVPDFWPEQLDEVDDILGSDVRVMEEFATGSKIKNPKKGENVVGQAEVRAENAADEAAERAAMEAEDFATGGLAKLLGE
tara:strand:+ start:126 stop:2093 length:1968 start_codon:yes stop_codon:yes gene_type:complete